MSYEYLCEKKLSQINPEYHALLSNTTTVLFHTLEKYKSFFPDFTDHTILHSIQVINFCNELIGENIEFLNDDELYILLMSAYLHDSGMGISEDDYEEMYDKVVSEDEREEYPYRNKRHTIRCKHHIFSEYFVYKYQAIFDIPSKEHVSAIAAVCKAHRGDLYDKNNLPNEFKLPSGNTARLPYLAALICLADELDIASDRNIGTDVSGHDTIFKMMHRSITHLDVFDDKFVANVNVMDQALFQSVKKEIGKLNDTLNRCKAIVAERTTFSIRQGSVEINAFPFKGKHITVLDTDLGIDDAFAIMMLRTQSIKPDFIIASYGNTSLERAVKNAVLLNKYFNINSRIVRGLENIGSVNCEKNEFHGTDGLAGIADEMMKKCEISEDELKEVMSFSEFSNSLKDVDSITYITIGSLTNISFLIDDINIQTKITGIYVMGGGLNQFNCSHDTEFNFSRDPKAVKKLLSSGKNITLFPLDVTNNLQISLEQINKLEELKKYTEMIHCLKFNRQSNISYNGIDAAVLHDILPLLYVSNPELAEIKDMRIISDEYGKTIKSEKGEAVHVCVKALEGLAYSKVYEAFQK